MKGPRSRLRAALLAMRSWNERRTNLLELVEPGLRRTSLKSWPGLLQLLTLTALVSDRFHVEVMAGAR